MIALVLAFAADPPLAEPSAPAAPPHLYLHPSPRDCDHAASDEVVVCSAKEQAQRYRLPSIDDRRYAELPVRAETGVGKGRLSLHNEDKVLGGDVHSRRAMVTFKLPL